MKPANAAVCIALSLTTGPVGTAGEDPSLPPYKWPNYPRYNLRTEHQPIKSWKIETLYRGEGRVYLRKSGLEREAKGVKSKDNPTAKGKDENVYLLHFDYADYRRLGGPPIADLEIDPTRPAFVGWDFHDFSTRFRRWTGERGLSRKYVAPAEFSCAANSVPLDVPNFAVDPESKDADWQRFLMPVVVAEGGGDYLIVNAFDKAGMTVGFIQMAAHTPNDMIPLMRHLIGHPGLKADSYANPERWFPELGLTEEGKLGYRIKSGEIVSLEESTKHRNSNEGFGKWSYFREDFVRFCNPDCRQINRAELHFAARWLMWSMSPKMRAAQLKPSRDNVVGALTQLEGVPGQVSAADAAIAAVILHWNDGAESRKRVAKLLSQPSPMRVFLELESRPGQPDAESIYGRMLAKQRPWWQLSIGERQVLNQRIEAVRMLFERDPDLLARLTELKFDFSTGELIGKIAANDG